MLIKLAGKLTPIQAAIYVSKINMGMAPRKAAIEAVIEARDSINNIKPLRQKIVKVLGVSNKAKEKILKINKKESQKGTPLFGDDSFYKDSK